MPKVQKILHLTLSAFAEGRKGGGERYVAELVAAEKAAGLTVRVVEFRGLRDIRLWDPAGSEPLSFNALLRLLRTSDVVHVHQLNSPGFDLAALSRAAWGKPVVLTDHGGGSLTPGRLLGRLRLPLIDGAAFVSDWSRRDVDPRSVIKTFDIVYGGGDHIVLGESVGQRADFAFIGRLLPHKGAHVAIEALPDGASLIVAGEARDGAYLEYLRKLAEGKDVSFLTSLADNSLYSLYTSVRALLVPSVSSFRGVEYKRPELLGLVALEALAAGTAVIGSDVGGLGELLRREGQRVVTPGDVREWSQVLTEALEFTPNVDSERYTWAEVARKSVAIYGMVVR